MFAGHFFIAFLIVSLFAYWKGIDKEQCLVLGVFAGGFAVLPDLDIVYALKGLSSIFLPVSVLDSFWSASKVIHRGISHSLVTGFIAASLFALGYEKNSYIGNIFSIIFLGVFAFFLDGWIGAGVLVLYGAVGGVLSTYAENYLSRKRLFAVALTGLMSHPFGDLFTGTPPDFLYPLNIEIISSRLVLFSDPVINIVSLLIFEVALILSGITFIAYLKDFDVTKFFNLAPLVGVLYGSVFWLIPLPSLSEAYKFVFSILLYSLTVPIIDYIIFERENRYLQIVLTGLLTVLVSAFAYLIVYLTV